VSAPSPEVLRFISVPQPRCPEAVRVLGVEVPVLVRDMNEDTVLDRWDGYTDHARGRIVLRAGHAEGYEGRETLLHELLHVLEKATCTALEEEEVGRLSRGLFAVLRDNPELVRWLMEGAE
jgi:hypothetical protein